MRFAMLLPVVHARQSTASAEDSPPVKAPTGPVRWRRLWLFSAAERRKFPLPARRPPRSIR